MEILHEVKDGWGLAAARGPGGWAMACRLVPDVDIRHCAHFCRNEFRLAPGSSPEAWAADLLKAGRTVRLMVDIHGNRSDEQIAHAERIEGSAVTWADGPAVAWSERAGGAWRLMLHANGNTECVHTSAGVLRAPAIAAASDGILIACEADIGGIAHVIVRSQNGKVVHQARGRRPVMADLPDGRAWLCMERTDRDAVNLVLNPFDGNRAGAEISLPSAGDYNINAHMACDGTSGDLYVVWAITPAWGWNELVGRHRELSLWRVSAGKAEPVPAAGTFNGFLHLPLEAYRDGISAHNWTPINPKIVLADGRVAVAYQMFRHFGVKGFGWDVFLLSQSGDRWSAPRRISPHLLLPDLGYAVLPHEKGLLLCCSCCDHTATQTFEECVAGRPRRDTQAATNFRIEVVAVGVEESLPNAPRAPWAPAAYEAPASVKNIAPEPPGLADSPAGLTLYWGDLHAHSSYSKCMSGNDGQPEDVLRLERDVLGCRILCLTEHIEYMRSPEFLHVLDRVEAECGDTCAPLYGVEWAMRPAHHTNFYAIDRGILERLRPILLTEMHLTAVYARIRKELPKGSVVALRHYHGCSDDEYGVRGAKFFESHDPELEVAMEAMQTRGNMMVPRPQESPFPSDFLNAGARLGLVGGSDHSRGLGPNSFCLTGFWLRDLTPEAVWQAILQRRTTAMSNGKLALYATLGSSLPGSETTVDKEVRVRVRAACAQPIRRMCLIRNGELLPWVNVNGGQADLELTDAPNPGKHWYVVTAEADSSAKSPIIAHASPFFVKVGG